MTTFPLLLRWASETGAQGMITVDEARYLGYEHFVGREGRRVGDPRYPGSWLMVKRS